MATMKDKFDRINMSKLPAEVKDEFLLIEKGSENFDPDYVDIYQENFDLLFQLVQDKYPEALKKVSTVRKTKPATKKKVIPKPKKEIEPPQKKDIVDECKSTLKKAGFTVKKIPSKKGGKPMVVKKKRQERTIIKDRVAETFKPILKDISGSKPKDTKYKEMQKTVSSIQNLISQLLQLLNNLAEDNSTEEVKKIEELLKKLLPGE